MVGEVRLELTQPFDDGFTVRCNCHYATLPLSGVFLILKLPAQKVDRAGVAPASPMASPMGVEPTFSSVTGWRIHHFFFRDI